MSSAEPRSASAEMDTAFGTVTIHALQWPDEPPYVVLRHRIPSADLIRLRVQAQCLTSTAFAATMCDCGEQIRAGVRLAATVPGAVMIYLPQEGRGYGLLSKVEIMARMNTGLTLVQAQRAVNRAPSRVSFHRVPMILGFLGVAGALALVTDSDAKARAIAAAGVPVTSIEPVSAAP